MVSKDDYEYDIDDDGHEIKRKITRQMLKDRLARAKYEIKQYADAQRGHLEEIRSLNRRRDNVYFCDQLREALGDGVMLTADAKFVIDTSYDDVSNGGPYRQVIPGMTKASLTVLFEGDPETLARVGKFLTRQ